MYSFNEVLPGLFIGSSLAIPLSTFESLPITHILSVDNFQNFPSGYTTKSLNINDDESENIMKHFEECINFIENNKTLVVCTAGRSRSATIIAAYLIKRKKMSLNQALSTILKVRKVQPNPGFMIQLFE